MYKSIRSTRQKNRIW